MTKLSFTIPCYRSAKTVEFVINEIREVVGQRPDYDYEIIAVNDCSPDNVYDVLCDIAATDKKIKVIDLAINGGKHAALMAAFAFVTGDIVVGVDDDGQCPVDRLWDLIEPLNNGYDMAMAKYPVKKQSGFKNFGSRMNARMSQSLLDKPKDVVFSNFTARKRFVTDEIIRYKNPYPYLEGLSLRTTRNIKMVEMEERSRISGKSGYTFRKSLALWFNGYTAFSVKPLRIATACGIGCAILGFVLAIVTIIRKLVLENIAMGYTSTLAVILVVGGIIMVLLGMLGEYIGRIYICINNSPQYVIRQTVNVDKEDRQK